MTPSFRLQGIATGRMFRTDSMSLGGNCTKQITVWGGWVFWDDLCNSLLLRKWRAKSFLDKQFWVHPHHSQRREQSRSNKNDNPYRWNHKGTKHWKAMNRLCLIFLDGFLTKGLDARHKTKWPCPVCSFPKWEPWAKAGWSTWHNRISPWISWLASPPTDK